MDLTTEVIEKIVELSAPMEMVFHGRPYTSKPMHPVKLPGFEQFGVSTLRGLCDLGKQVKRALVAHPLMVVVEAYDCVRVRAAEYSDWREAPVFVSARPYERKGFLFERFLPVEQFCIELLSKFQISDELQELVGLVSKLEGGIAHATEDTGISQKATLRTGVATRDNVQVRSHWRLKPFRTFAELEQPETSFLLRLKQDDRQAPHCALFEADGGAWKTQAHEIVRLFLAQELTDDWLIVA